MDSLCDQPVGEDIICRNNLRHGKTILSIVYLAVFSSGFLRQANARIAIVTIDLSTQSKIFESPPSNSWRFWQA
jgi:hypothetical protein